MRISSFLFCVLSISLVSGIPVPEYNGFNISGAYAGAGAGGVAVTMVVNSTNHNLTHVDELRLLNISDTNTVVDKNITADRKLLRFLPKIFSRPAPKHVPAPAPKPAPKPAPVFVIKVASKPAPAPKPAPKATPAPKPAPKATPAPKPAPKAVPAPKPAPKATPAPKPAPKAIPAPKPAPKAVPKPVLKTILPSVLLKGASVTQPSQKVDISMTCDNAFHLYVNGVKVGQGNYWTTTYKFSPMVKPGDVIAIDCIDEGGPAAFIGVFNGKITKASDWRCSTKETSGWNKNVFDDSAWTKAVSYGRNQDNNIWKSVGKGSRPNIPGDAEWLWTSDNNNHNRVFCRYFPTFNNAPVVAAPKVVVAAPVVAPKAAPKVVVAAPKASPKVVVAAPKAAPKVVVAAPKAAPVVAAPKVVVVAPKTTTVIDEIIKNNMKANLHISSFQTKIVRLITENNDQQKKIQDENRNSYNGASITLQNAEKKLADTNKEMKKLYDDSVALNMTIQRHYKKLIVDSNYLHSLDVLRPTFLKSLDELNTHIAGIKTTVETKLIKDEYKDEMVSLLSDMKVNTYNVSGYLSDYFVKHYNKYKSLIDSENSNYSDDLKRLNILATKYRIEAQKSADLLIERNKLEAIVKKMKETYILTIEQQSEFDMLVKQIMTMFDNKKC